VVEQLRRVPGGEAGPGPHLDPARRGQRVRRELVDDPDGGRVVGAEVRDHPGGQDVGHFLRRVVAAYLERQADAVEPGQDLVHTPCELVGGGGVVAQRRVRCAVELPAVHEERLGAPRRQHPGRQLDRLGDRLQPVVHERSRVDRPADLAHGVDDWLLVERWVIDGRERVGATGEKLLAHRGRPAQRRQHADRLGDRVQLVGHQPVALRVAIRRRAPRSPGARRFRRAHAGRTVRAAPHAAVGSCAMAEATGPALSARRRPPHPAWVNRSGRPCLVALDLAHDPSMQWREGAPPLEERAGADDHAIGRDPREQAR